MTELWFPLAILSAILFSGADIVDKFVIDHELRDPVLATIFNGISTFLLFSVVSFIFGFVVLPVQIIVLAVIAGVLYSGALLLYFEAMYKEDVSFAAPLLSTAPLFVLFLGYIFLSEQFTTGAYVGIGLIISGAFLISLKSFKHKLKFSKILLFVLLAAVLLALRTIIIKYTTLSASIWSVLFWVGIGGLLITGLLYGLHHPHIKKRWKRGVEHILFVGVVSAVGFFFLVVAISIGPASLVSATVATKPLFVFLAATVLSIFYPKFIKEKITPAILLQKSIAIVLIVIGAVLIV